MCGGGRRKGTGHLGQASQSSEFSFVSHRQSRGRAWRQAVRGEQMMCRRAGSQEARTDHPVVSGLVGCNFASHPSPFCPMRSAGGSDIDNASKPVVLVCGGGRCWVATPRKVKKDLGFTDSASSVPQLRTRTGQDRTGSQGLDRPGHRSGSRPQNSTLVESSIEHVLTAPQPLRTPCHRAGTVIRGGMLCIIATMYSLSSPMSVEGQYPPSRRLLASAPSGPVSRQRPCGPGPSQKLFEPSPSARVGFVLFWGRPKRGVDPSTRGALGSPFRASDGSLPRSCHRALSFYRGAIWRLAT